MLQRLTNGRLRSTPHRVVNPPPEREQPKWPPITADDHLQERLREIKLA